MSLDRRLALALVVLLVAMGAAGVAATLWTTSRHLEEVDQRLHHDLAAQLVAKYDLLDAEGVHSDTLKQLFMTLMVVNPRLEVYLLDRDGRIVGYDAPPGRVRMEAVDLGPIRDFLAGAPPPLRGDDPRHPGRRKVFTAATVPADAPIAAADGFLYAILGGEQYGSVRERLQSSYILRLGAWAIAAGAVITLILGLLSFRLLTRRLRILDRQMREVAASDFRGLSPAPPPEPPEPRRGDEIDRLDRTFRRMVTKIAEQIAELGRTDRLRRELVANVSHDLRTPLASLQGYLETLSMKGASLSENERREYLEVALSQSQRLARLVASLFELSKLDAGDEAVEPETFPIAELVQDIAHKLRLVAHQAGVELEVELGGGEHWVESDVRLLERALENLVVNAIEHTKGGGKVRVTVADGEDGRVSVSVADSGCGIPADELPHVFDRYFRGKRGGERRDGAGLGLAIARRIVELHGSKLEIESREGVGTTLRFTLAAAPPPRGRLESGEPAA